MAGIYIHIPFCRLACHYCDFHFSTNRDVQGQMVEAIVREISLQQEYLAGERIKTIYFGGGTPSLLLKPELQSIVETVNQLFAVDQDAEITMEVNPDDLSPEKLNDIRDAGVNRLSIGIQSFDDAILSFLNRSHDAKAAIITFEQARTLGFNNISIDLIYAIPGQADDLWIKNIEQAVALSPEHISAYALTIEEKTVFGRWKNKGRLSLVDDDSAARQLEILVDKLDQAGYDQYEVSNFSKPGFESKHNSSYWKGEKYLGVGPSAHSFNGASRQYNINNNHIYIKNLHAGIIPFEKELLTIEDHINEYLLTRLRTKWGCDLNFIKEKFNYDLLATNNSYVRNLVENHLATLDNNQLILTKSGKLVADKISSDLFLLT